jgi:hypothetical protein
MDYPAIMRTQSQIGLAAAARARRAAVLLASGRR